MYSKMEKGMQFIMHTRGRQIQWFSIFLIIMPLDVLNAAEFDSSAWMLSRCKCCVVIRQIQNWSTTIPMSTHLVVRDFCWSLVLHHSELVQLCWFQLRHVCILRQLPDFRLNILKVKKLLAFSKSVGRESVNLIKLNKK